MKLIAHAVTALALLAFATPALPCSADKQKTTTASSASGSSPTFVTKSGTAEKKDEKTKDKAETKPATAAN